MNDTTLTTCYAMLRALLSLKGREASFTDDVRDLYDLVLLPLDDAIGLQAVKELCIKEDWPPTPASIKEYAAMLKHEECVRNIKIERPKARTPEEAEEIKKIIAGIKERSKQKPSFGTKPNTGFTHISQVLGAIIDE